MLMRSDDVGSTFKNKRRNFRTKLMTSQDVRTEFRNFRTSQIRASDSRSGHNQMNEDSFCLGVTTCHFNGTSTARTAEECDTCESKPFKWCLLPKAKVGQRGIISKRNQWQFQWGYHNKHHHIWDTRATLLKFTNPLHSQAQTHKKSISRGFSAQAPRARRTIKVSLAPRLRTPTNTSEDFFEKNAGQTHPLCKRPWFPSRFPGSSPPRHGKSAMGRWMVRSSNQMIYKWS